MRIQVDINESYKEDRVIIQARTMSEEVSQVIRAVQNKDASEYITGMGEGKNHLLVPSDIDCVYAQAAKVYVVKGSETYEVRQRLYELEELLFRFDFIKVNRSELVNIAKIDYFESDLLGSLVIYLKCGRKSYVSRRCVKAIKERLGV